MDNLNTSLNRNQYPARLFKVSICLIVWLFLFLSVVLLDGGIKKTSHHSRVAGNSDDGIDRTSDTRHNYNTHRHVHQLASKAVALSIRYPHNRDKHLAIYKSLSLLLDGGDR